MRLGAFVQHRTIAIFLPHEWLGWMLSSDLEDKKQHLISGVEHLESFWAAHRLDDPKLKNSPLMEDPENLHKYIPFMLHGDGGSFQRHDSINVISFRSLLSAANVATSQFLICALPKSAINKGTTEAEDTMFHIWSLIVWSLKFMFWGKYPEVDHLGKKWPETSFRAKMAGCPLAPMSLKGYIMAVSGDGDWFQNELKLPGHSYNECCWNCKANKSDIPFNDFRPNSAWRTTIVNHNGTCPTSHVLSQVPGICGESFSYDILHILDEGIASHIIANCCFDFVMRGSWEGTQEQKLQTLNQKIMQQYQEQGIPASNRVSKVGMTNFCNPKSKWDIFPELSGFKARHIRYLVPVFIEIAAEFVLPSDAYSISRHKCLCHLEQMYGIMEDEKLHLPAAKARAFEKSCESMLQHYNKCCKVCLSQGLIQWNVVHKHHVCAHLPAQATFLNPKYVSTYSGETMVGKISALGHACLNGTPGWLVCEKVCWRFRLGMALKLQGTMELMEDDEEE